jgi:hypothetical protein
MNACIAIALNTPMRMQYLEECPNVSFCMKKLAIIDNGSTPTWLHKSNAISLGQMVNNLLV